MKQKRANPSAQPQIVGDQNIAVAFETGDVAVAHISQRRKKTALNVTFLRKLALGEQWM